MGPTLGCIEDAEAIRFLEPDIAIVLTDLMLEQLIGVEAFLGYVEAGFDDMVKDLVSWRGIWRGPSFGY